MEPNLLYQVRSDPTDPRKVWNTLADQLQRKTWENKLQLKRKLPVFSMRLNEGGSVQEHIKSMTVLCDELSAIGETVNEENRVVYLLASLLETYSVLITALEANTNVSSLPVVTERLLHEETKRKGQNPTSQEEAVAAKFKKSPICYFCRKHGHIQEGLRGVRKAQGSSKACSGDKVNKDGGF